MQLLTVVDAQSIFNSLDGIVVNQLGLSWFDIIAVCFNGASTMAGKINGVQAKCNEKNPKMFYVHCHAHCLSLVLIVSIDRSNCIVFDFFGTMQFSYAFIEASCIHHSI